MKRALAALALALGLAAGAQATHQVAQLEDVVLLAQEGLSNETIIAFLETREIGFALDAREILRLRDAGVSEEIIRYLLERTAAGSRPSPAYAAAYVPPVVPSYYGSSYYASGYSAPYGYLGLSLFPSTWFQHRHGYLLDHHGVHHGASLGHHQIGGHHFDAPHDSLGHTGLGQFGHVGGSGVHVQERPGHHLSGGHVAVGHGVAHGGGHAAGHGGHPGGAHGGHGGGHGGHGGHH